MGKLWALKGLPGGVEDMCGLMLMGQGPEGYHAGRSQGRWGDFGYMGKVCAAPPRKPWRPCLLAWAVRQQWKGKQGSAVEPQLGCLHVYCSYRPL
eukprot:scaffold189262_cov20-Tisochrysis_lutea.AAC.8